MRKQIDAEENVGEPHRLLYLREKPLDNFGEMRQ